MDIADANKIGQVLFGDGFFPSCVDAMDANGDTSPTVADGAFILDYLFIGGPAPPPPGPDTPGPDPEPGNCDSYNPVPSEPSTTFALGFECPPVPAGEPGSTVRFQSWATLTASERVPREGAEGWSIGMGTEGLRIVSVTTAGTAGALTTDDPPGYRKDFFSIAWSEVVDPGPGTGAVSAVLLDGRAGTHLPLETVRILALTLEATIPAEGIAAGRLFFAEGKDGSGQPVPNRVTLRAFSHIPVATDCEVRIGDCNANGQVDSLDISAGSSLDCTGNGLPDECEPDCNGNSKADSCDIAGGSPDCDRNGVPDSCDIADGQDCNGNAIPDSCDIDDGTSTDCDSNGIPDSCDVDRVFSEDCNGNGRIDACDIVSRSSLDADRNGVPDECEVCPPKEPVECPGGPAFRYTFRGPCSAVGEVGAEVELVAFGRIETHCLEAGSPGAQGWALSVAVEGCRLIEATTRGTAAALTTRGGLRDVESFEKTAIIDPAHNGGKMGVVSAIALSNRAPLTLPPEDSPHDVIRLTLAAAIPADCSECVLRYEDGLIGQATPVHNFVRYGDGAAIPLLAEMRIELCPASAGGLQKPGDENQDGDFNLSDPISILNHLFSGLNPTLPCGDGTKSDAANIAILDLNQSGQIDLSDPIYALNFLFSDGSAPKMGVDCLRVPGCQDVCGA